MNYNKEKQKLVPMSWPRLKGQSQGLAQGHNRKISNDHEKSIPMWFVCSYHFMVVVFWIPKCLEFLLLFVNENRYKNGCLDVLKYHF